MRKKHKKNISEITKATREVSEQYPIKKVQLFGSYADNSATDDSEIDVANSLMGDMSLEQFEEDERTK